MKETGLTGAAAVLGGACLARMAHAQGSDVLRVGLIGCGGRGTGAAVNALNADPHAKLVAMADLFEDRLTGSLERLRVHKPSQIAVDDEHCFVGFDAYQKLIDSGVDVVLLAAPPHFRPKHLKAAVAAGKHIFAEKPVAVDVPGVQSVMESVDEAKSKGLSLVSGLCWRYHPGVRATIEKVRDGAIGKIVTIQETYLCGRVGRFVERTPDMSEMEYQLRCWTFFNWLSGDQPVEQFVHSLDKAAWVLGDRPPTRCWGMGGRQVPKIGDIFDHHGVVFEFDNGVRVYAYCRQQNGCYNEVSDIIFGTQGEANVLKHRISGENRWRYKGPKANYYDLEHEALFTSIRKNEPINDGDYMANSTMMGIMARMATYSGKMITYDEAIQSTESLGPKTYALDGEPPTRPDAEGRYPIPMPGITTG